MEAISICPSVNLIFTKIYVNIKLLKAGFVIGIACHDCQCILDIFPLFYPSFPRGEGGWGDLKHLHYHRICFGVLILAQW